MSELTLGDLMGILIAIGPIFSAAEAVDGLAQALVVFVGVVIALLWVGNFVLRGYMDAQHTPRTDS